MIQTETTPNPDSLKFLCEKTLSAIGTEEFKKEKEKEIKIPFVKELLNFKGVELILLSEKFLSVKKNKEVPHDEIKRPKGKPRCLDMTANQINIS